jgi:hypothetical protein
MAKGEREQASGRQGRKAAPINEKKPRRAVSGEAQFREPSTQAGTKNRNKTSGAKAGARQGNRRHSGAKPSGTNVSEGGGSAAKKRSSGASAARGKSARST